MENDGAISGPLLYIQHNNLLIWHGLYFSHMPTQNGQMRPLQSEALIRVDESLNHYHVPTTFYFLSPANHWSHPVLVTAPRFSRH